MRFQSDGNCGILLLFGSYFKEIMRTFLELSCACMNLCSHECNDFARCDNLMYVYYHSHETLQV
jgi:hypothetical protein